MNAKISIREKVNVAICHLQNEDPAGKISISKICRLVNINRSNLYENYPDIIETIKKLKPLNTKRTNSKKDYDNLLTENKNLKMQVKALTIICLDMKYKINQKQ